MITIRMSRLRNTMHSQETLERSNQQLDDDQVVIDNQSIFAAPEDQSTWEPEENILD